MPYQSNSAACDVSLARFGLRIIRAMQPSAARGKTAERVASRKQARPRVQRSGAAKDDMSKPAVRVVAVGLVAGGRPSVSNDLG